MTLNRYPGFPPRRVVWVWRGAETKSPSVSSVPFPAGSVWFSAKNKPRSNRWCAVRVTLDLNHVYQHQIAKKNTLKWTWNHACTCINTSTQFGSATLPGTSIQHYRHFRSVLYSQASVASFSSVLLLTSSCCLASIACTVSSTRVVQSGADTTIKYKNNNRALDVAVSTSLYRPCWTNVANFNKHGFSYSYMYIWKRQ